MSRYRQNFSLYKRNDYYYYRTYNLEGKRTSGKSTGCKTLVKARGYCEDLYKKGLLFAGSNGTFKSYVNGYLSEESLFYKKHFVKKEERNGSNIKSRIAIIQNWLIPYFGEYKVSAIRVDHIYSFREFLKKQGKADSTIDNILSLLSSVFSQMVQEDILPASPFKNYIKPKKVVEIKDAFSLDEIKAIVKNTKNEAKLLFAIAACTGLRISEVMGIRTQNIKENHLVLTHQRIKKEYCLPKNGKSRIIPLCIPLKKLIVDNINDFGELDVQRSYNFFSDALYYILPEFKDYKKRKLSIHSTRHFFNTYMLAHNISSVKVAVVMGHALSNANMQGRYTNFKADDFKDIITEQEKLFYEIAPFVVGA